MKVDPTATAKNLYLHTQKLQAVICSICLILLLSACGDEKIIYDPPPQESTNGLVYGTVTDVETHQPIGGVIVTLNDVQVITEVEGKFSFQEVPFADALQLQVEIAGYEPLTKEFDFHTSQLEISVELQALADPLEQLEAFLDSLQAVVEADDLANIPDIQGFFAEEYTVPLDDPATFFAIQLAPIPENFEDIEPSMTELFQEYDNITFAFQERQFGIPNATTAQVMLVLHIHTERGPRPDKTDLNVRCELRFRNDGERWLITFWRLIELEQQQDE